MIAFQQSSDFGTITWVPGPKLQKHLAPAPPEVLAALEDLIKRPLLCLSAILTGSLEDSSHTGKVFDDLVRGLTEVAQRAHLRLNS